MHHVAEPLDDEALGHLHRPQRRHPPDVVAAEVEQHQMFGTLLRVGQQFRLQRLVFLIGRPAPPRARQRPDRHHAIAQPHQHLRRGPHDRKRPEIQIEQEGRRIDPPQRPIQGERRQREGHREALADDDLEGIARGDVLLAPPHRLDEPGLGKVRAWRRRVRQHHRRRLSRQRPVQCRLRFIQPGLRLRPGGLGRDLG